MEVNRISMVNKISRYKILNRSINLLTLSLYILEILRFQNVFERKFYHNNLSKYETKCHIHNGYGVLYGPLKHSLKVKIGPFMDNL